MQIILCWLYISYSFVVMLLHGAQQWNLVIDDISHIRTKII